MNDRNKMSDQKVTLTVSARFSQKVVRGKKPPSPKNLAAHLEKVPLTPKN